MTLISSVTLRPYTEKDQDEVISIHRTIYPEYDQEKNQWRPGQQFDNPASLSHRYVACERGHIIGYAAIREQYRARYRINLMVHPKKQRCGVGTRLFSIVLKEANQLNAITLQARVRSDQPAALQFLHQSEFSEVHRMRGMTLSIDHVDFANLQPTLDRVLSSGIDMTTLAQEQLDENAWLARLHELYHQVSHGWPA